MDQIRIGIVGYGNLGRGVEYALRQNPDMALVGVFTRRPPSSLTLQTPGVPVYPLDALDGMEGAVDVLLLCGGSAADLPEQSPRYAGRFHLVDSFDTHANIPAHFAAVDAAARAGGKTAIISAGWDPGLFSLVRALAAAVLPLRGELHLLGPGVSQGHSDAVRRIPGVRDARQYTIPVPAALDAVRSGANPALTTRQKHMRECFVVAEEGPTGPASSRRSSPCPTTLPTTTPRCTFSLRRSCSGTTAACPTAALSSAAAARAGRNRTGPWWNSN